jgi:sugar-specific transcriptional regulator TrmB
MEEEREVLIEALVSEVGLSPYEAKAYLALLYNGPLSPTGVNQKSGIPRPRTYDVLNSLVGKGLVMEQPGKPTRYLAVDPEIGLKKMTDALEKRTLREVEQKRASIDSLMAQLSEPYSAAQDIAAREDIVWVTRKDSAMIARYTEAIRNVQREFVLITALSTPPSKEILDAVRDLLKRKKSSRVIRPIGPDWLKKDLEDYIELIRLGDDIRHLDYDGLTFAVFDRKEALLWLPPHPSEMTLWIRLPQLAEVLMTHFTALWEKAEPALPLLEKMRKQKG